MVNKKLSEEDEENIYLDWLSGEQLSSIAKRYPVVVSTVQRVVEKKKMRNKCSESIIIQQVYKLLNKISLPIESAVKLSEKTKDEDLPQKLKERLIKKTKELNDNMMLLILNLKGDEGAQTI